MKVYIFVYLSLYNTVCYIIQRVVLNDVMLFDLMSYIELFVSRLHIYAICLVHECECPKSILLPNDSHHITCNDVLTAQLIYKLYLCVYEIQKIKLLVFLLYIYLCILCDVVVFCFG